MKVPLKWLNNLVDYNSSTEDLVTLFNHKTIGTKEVTDKFIELDMKGYNRADLLSLRGVAYEVSALTDSPVNFTEQSETDYYWVNKSLSNLDVVIKDSDDTPLYCLVKIENLKVQSSSPEWVEKLSDSGVRTVNNIADITNLIMLEFGQPLHAFDASKVVDEKIIVRRANEGEQITTLDNKKRTLSKDDLVIADSEQAIGIAGVMGGKDSEITDQTTTIILEAAIFNPTILRKTATKLALSSEASKRFYHGLTSKRLMQALNAAIKMYADLGGQISAISISGESNDQLQKIPLRLTKTSRLIGENITPEQSEGYFKRLHFDITDKVINNDESSYVVTPPYYRLDLQVEEDVIEEIARLYDYKNITAHPVPETKLQTVDQSAVLKMQEYKNALKKAGFSEVFTYPYYSNEVLQTLGFLEGNNRKILIKIANPISNQTEFLRLNLWPNLLEAAAKNFKQGFKEFAIFELGKTYSLNAESKPNEEYHISGVLVNQNPDPIYELLQMYNQFIQTIALNQLSVEKSTPSGIAENFFHPTRFLKIKKEEQIGALSEIHPKIADAFGLNSRIAVFETTLF